LSPGSPATATSHAKRGEGAQALFDQTGLAINPIRYNRREIIFSQGSPADNLFFLQRGMVKISVVSKQGKEAIIDVLSTGAFFGESCLAGESVHSSSAEALMVCSVIPIKKPRLISALRNAPELAEFLIAYLSQRNLRTKEDLASQLFSSREKRLARMLVRLAELGQNESGGVILPSISQETLALMVGTTRSRVNFFINKFKRLGLVSYDKGLRILPALISLAQRN
jgi:CRP/FNR family cyclic AMP-dependent transcriptional regulator